MTRHRIPTLLADFYKIGHREAYPEGTQTVYSTWTPRTSRVDGIKHVVAFGFQGFIKKYLIEFFNESFFNRPKADVIAEYTRVIKNTLGVQNPSTQHLEDLHDLGYLPILIKAIPEGLQVPIRVPMLTIENTDPRFFWLTNFLETLMSCELWLASTSATTAHKYREILDAYATQTGDPGFVQFQGHDFSMRGMGALEAAELSGSGHLLSFVGTDTIPAITYLEEFYNADIEKELVGCSVNATEHSVMCAGGSENEFETYRRLMFDVYPTGILSIVSDTWDFWGVLANIIRPMKNAIMNRDGKIVIRPDSGDPVLIICGDPDSNNLPAHKGAVEVLWDIFGGTVNEKGYKCLNPHIGLIYGDAITLDRCRNICAGLERKGFASTNVVFGIGSYTYQYVTRDTFGFALKSTHVVINGEDVNIFKDPLTDSGVKKSAIGRVAVLQGDELFLRDGYDSKTQVIGDMLWPLFENGKLLRDDTLATIRRRLATQKTEPEFSVAYDV
jgi:nicotinamide phosphoribosyltransferase